MMQSGEQRSNSTNKQARRDALAAMATVAVGATGIVNFATSGRVLVIGEDEKAITVARDMPPTLTATAVVLDAPAVPSANGGVVVVTTRRAEFDLQGHLGEFRARLQKGGKLATFDLVLDLCREPVLGDAWPRFGYHAVPSGRGDIGTAVEAMVEEVGEFEKPRYFRYDPDLCIRGRSGFTACNRCVQACPAGAITGLAERIEVDPHLCQGGGVCATVCPGGALQYAYPSAEDAIARLRRLLETYRDAGGGAAELLIHDEYGTPALETLADNLLPYTVEEVASVGMEFWLSAVAFGARAVHLVSSERLTHEVRAALDVQLADTDSLLTGLGFPSGVAGWYGDTGRAGMPDIRPAAFAAAGSKREILFLALDHLVAQAGAAVPEEIELPATVALGEILVDPAKCTLCVSCATVCPRGAVSAEEDRPALLFFESRCVQCGLCEQACPERAIQLHARLLTDRGARNRRRILHEEQPFECIRCGKPFATRSSIERVLDRLGGHALFADQVMRDRLQMCADCRVIDMMLAEGKK